MESSLTDGKVNRVSMAGYTKPQTLYYQQAIRKIEREGVEPLYLLFGEEYLLGDNLIKHIQKHFLQKVEPELNYFVRYATEGGFDAVLSLCAGMALFTEKKLIILKEAQSLKQKDIERLVKFLKRKLRDICLILYADVTSLNKMRLKNVESVATPVNLLPLRTSELKNFIQTEFNKYEKEITQEAIEMLIFMVGTQLADLLVQINNVSQYFTDDKKIDIPHIEQIASVYVTQNVFELNRLIGNRETEKAIFVLHNLLDSGISPQMIISQLLRHFSLIWKIQGLRRSGIKNAETLARELKIYSRYFQEYDEQSRSWKTSSIMKVLKALHDTDRNLKESNVNPKIALDILCQRVINC